MSNQPEHDNQQPETLTSEELRQYILAELEASKQEIAELSDDQLVEIAGGALGSQGIGFNGNDARTSYDSLLCRCRYATQSHA